MITLILFIIYASLIFFIKDYYELAIIFAINLMLMIILKINAKNALKFCVKLLPFIIFTIVINLILSNIEFAILVGIRLILVGNITYIFSKKMTPRKLQMAIEKICIPLKIFKVNNKEIGIIVSTSIAFIPIIKKEMQDLKYSLKSKGFKMNFKNIITKPNYILMVAITNIIKRTVEIEQCMISKGYIS